MAKTKETAVSEMETPKNEIIPAGTGFVIDVEDIDIPRINVCQKMTDSDAPVGSLLFDKEHILAGPNDPLKVTPVAAQKGWREDIPFDDEGIPRIAWTKAEADALAADSDFKLNEFAEITLLIEQPTGYEGVCDDAFQLPIGDRSFAIGKMNVGKNAYRTTYKRLATFAALQSGAPIQSKVWNLKSEELSKGKYTWYNPSLTATSEYTDDDTLTFVKNFLGL